MPVDQARLSEVIEQLNGTCKNLDDFATEEEQNNDEFLKELDDQIFCCEQCGWWCEISDQNDEVEDMQICTDCSPPYDER